VSDARLKKNLLITLKDKIFSKLGILYSTSYFIHEDSECKRNKVILRGRIKSGWYFIELKMGGNFSRQVIKINIDAPVVLEKSSHTMVVYNHVLHKRIIFVSRPESHLTIESCIGNMSGQLLSCRLVRVTENFARNRVVKKLKEVHPRYKYGELDISQKVKIKSLWSDYNSILEGGKVSDSYDNWIKHFESSGISDNKTSNSNILISVILPVYNPKIQWLKHAIESVILQTYQNWQLCIVDDNSENPAIRKIISEYQNSDSRIKALFRKSNGHISQCSNDALSIATGEWITLLDHDDLLSPEALNLAIQVIEKNDGAKLIYTDEDKIDEQNNRFSPYFKPEWNRDLFYSHNMISHLGFYKLELVRKIGGFRIGYEGSQDYDLALRYIEKISDVNIFHIPKVLYHWRMHIGSTSFKSEVKNYSVNAAYKALQDHVERSGIPASVIALNSVYRLQYKLPSLLPKISIIILTKNKEYLLRKCIESILNKTSYQNYEITVVDNASDETDALDYLKSISIRHNVNVIRNASPFNYSKLNNDAVSAVDGEVIALLNNDVEVINEEWLTEMVSHALRPEVGVVGAKLYYPDHTVQHAGVILGIHGIAGHAHRLLPRHSSGYCGRANLIQSFSAVTGACMVVRKLKYQQVGGMNEEDLPIACNDIDFCLKLREAGYRNIWTPYAELFHHESASRGFDNTPEKRARSEKEVAYMQSRWGDLIKNDPAYNPNLTLDYEDFSLAWPPRTFKKY
jgi:GT2 family glycosyltransferase